MIEGLARQILRHYGLQHQKAKAIEELAELIVALQKDLLSGKEKHSRAVLEEIADVHIMLMQMTADEEDEEFVDKIIRQKLDRQLRRIEAEKGNSKTCDKCMWCIRLSPLMRKGICYCPQSDEHGNYVNDKMTCQRWER
nr:MAG TPA: nucleoside triphosphate pyrophosphohydrolase [Caudoviricetes sp.]